MSDDRSDWAHQRGMKYQPLPPALSEEDRNLVAELHREIDNLRRRYQEEVDPLVKRIVDIHNKYPQRGMFVPDDS